ncbi:8764_t:CDS:2 [Ambispora gerdemannii]|uniref:8764_t:CDS:1 n=1 Tax=Ambispora gerdemannii TaxID=144530 RepID=A0A9N9DMT9_9GLOM|nr:8764_t:CDS:2 [Ambispora gerdemannii]
MLKNIIPKQQKIVKEAAAQNTNPTDLIDVINKDIDQSTGKQKKFVTVDNSLIDNKKVWTSHWKEICSSVTLPYLKNENIIIKKKKVLLTIINDNVKSFQTKSKQNVESFENYQKDLNNFCVKYRDWTKEQLDKTDLTIEQIKTNIITLESEISIYQNKIIGLGIRTGVGAFISVSGLGLSVATGPVGLISFGIAALIDSLATISCGVALDVILNKLAAAQNELSAEHYKLDQLIVQKDHIQ